MSVVFNETCAFFLLPVMILPMTEYNINGRKPERKYGGMRKINLKPTASKSHNVNKFFNHYKVEFMRCVLRKKLEVVG